MTRTTPPSRWRRMALLAATALAASTLPVLAGSVGTASAMTIDCGYSPGLKSFIDNGGAPGVKCAGSAGASGSTGGSSSSSGGGTGSGSGGGANCQPHQNLLPANFIENATRNDSTSFSSWVDHASGSGTTTVRNYLNNRLHGSLQLYRQFKDGRTSWVMIYSLFQNGTMSQAIYTSGQPCGTGYTYIEPIKAPAPSGVGEARELLAAPGVSTTPLLGALETRGAMTPVPGSSDRYFVRVDVTNPAGAPVTGADVVTEFGWSFDLAEVVSVPAGTSCETEAGAIEHCSVGALDPGQTRSILFTATAKPGVASDAELPVTVSNLAREKTSLEHRPGLTGEFQILRPVVNLYKLERPAPATPVVMPTSPVCTSDSAPGATALPGTEGDQTVMAGQATKLVRHCSNTAALPMTASALHGTATLDSYGWITYTPDAGHRGADTVTVVTTNPESGAQSAPTSFTVNVVAPAEATDDAYAVVSGSTLSTAGSVLDNDRVPPTEGWLIQQGATPPAHGSLTLDTKTGRFTYTPAPGYVGSDSFRYRLSGPGGAASNVVTVTFTVTPR